jgi:molecular chaperone DnaK (HSP70)
MSNQQKVRTMLAYGQFGMIQWGTEVDGNAVTLVNTKLDLGPRETRLDELESTLYFLRNTGGLSFAYIRKPKSNSSPAFTPNSPTQIVTDYLTQIREAACREDGGIDLEQLARTNTPVDIVITVPVGWPYEAKNATFRAFRDAGFDKTFFPTLQNTIMVSEPEAASYYVARDLLESGEDFLDVCQALAGF